MTYTTPLISILRHMRGYQIQTRRSFQNLLTSKNSHKRQEHMLRKTSVFLCNP
ncbi:unnamed protein product [Brassica rapa]|uniref:Uncharacterized protein n=2 Tax=Brassica TaxID=3705 RepID=A0A3P5YF26_BRACM|nr:unnamed protein product [Brassica napus]CAG7859985.1 unnamed protein product [Brassica rapa]CDY19936.1 BnaA09g03150D [Brassica napus]VDC58488.1 unnamed protein product [Brassica rapa]